MSKKKKEAPLPADPTQRPPAASPFAGLSKGRSVGFATSNGTGLPHALPSVAAAAAARTAAAPQGPEIAPSTATDDVTKARPQGVAATPAPQPAPAAAAPPAPPPQEKFAPPAAPFSATSHDWMRPSAPSDDPRARAGNEWQARSEQRDDFARRRLSEQIPQGESQIVHAWFNVVASGVPPAACTIWLTRSEPEPPYTIMIPGEAVAGEMPDRSLFQTAERRRRQAGVPEIFTCRIEAATRDGKKIQMGTGMLYLPPDANVNPAAAGAGQWQAPPGVGWTPPQGNNGGNPWGGMPPWMMGMNPWMMGMNPWMMGMGGGGSFGSPGFWGPSGWQQQQPPAALQGKPELIALWELMTKTMGQQQQQNPLQEQLMNRLLDVAFREKPAEKPQGIKEQLGDFAAIATSLDAIRGKGGDSDSPAISVTYVDDGNGGRMPIVAQGGKVDTTMTVGIPMVGAVRGAVSKIGARIGGSGGVAKGQSPQPKAPAQVNAAAATNGEAKH